MTNKLIGLVAGIFLGGSATLFAQGEAKPANVGEGTVMHFRCAREDLERSDQVEDLDAGSGNEHDPPCQPLE